ncbi:uncharacterized protein LOC117285708 [Fukomys damarensis]|uniref:uncharacterized protein LOC117285708 n=1 Tax=Fukomys damarensis TaxID=885580 RepID=UPI0014558BD6|nr:uncharacterized protein LOC117285708 [Fukomys damarensis]
MELTVPAPCSANTHHRTGLFAFQVFHLLELGQPDFFSSLCTLDEWSLYSHPCFSPKEHLRRRTTECLWERTDPHQKDPEPGERVQGMSEYLEPSVTSYRVSSCLQKPRESIC